MGRISKSTWDSYSPAKQGSIAHEYCTTPFRDGGRVDTNTSNLTISQNPTNLSLGTPRVSKKGGIGTGAAGSQYAGQPFIVKYTNSSNIVSAITSGQFRITHTEESSTSTTTGWSNTTETKIGAQVTAGLDSANNVQFSSSLTNSTQIDSSNEKGVSNTESVTTVYGYTIPALKPGQGFGAYVWEDTQYVTIPYSAPITASGNSQETWADIYWKTTYSGILDWDKHTWTVHGDMDYSGQDCLSWANVYDSPASANIKFGDIEGKSQYYLDATGTITNVALSSANVKYFTPGSPDAPSGDPLKHYSQRRNSLVLDASSAEENNINNQSLGKVKPQNTSKLDFESYQLEVGLMFVDGNKKDGSSFTGTNTDDYFELRGKNQTAHLFGGDDYLDGSKFADKVIAEDDGLGSDVINTKQGDDIIIARGGAYAINSGKGNDQIKVTADKGNLIDDIILGEGLDQLRIDLSDDVKETAFIVRDLTREDNLILEHGSLDVEIFGSSVELYNDGSHVGTLIDYAAEFDQLVSKRSEVIEFGLLNMDSLQRYGNNQSMAEWRTNLIKADIHGSELIDNYSELIGNKKDFEDNIKSLQRYVFSKASGQLTKWATKNCHRYDDMTSFTSALVSRATSIDRSASIDGLDQPWVDSPWLNHSQELS